MDFVDSLGPGFLAHRLRRASDAILEASAAVLRREGFQGPARSVSMLLLLRGEGALGVTAIAERLRLSHPMVIKLARALGEAGLIEDEADARDRRRRMLALTAKGREQAAIAERVAGAVARVARADAAPLLRALADFADGLAADPLERRLTVALATIKEGERP